MSAGLFRLLIASGVVFALSLALALLDAMGWLVLPQPARPFIPVVLVASTLLGIVLLSGTIGIPKNPRHAPEAPGDAASDAEPLAADPESAPLAPSADSARG